MISKHKDYFCHESSFVDDNVIIGKKTKIWHFSHIQSGAVIGSHCSLGQNVNIGNNVKIGNNSIIGAGSVVTKNIPNNVLAFGVPSKIIKSIK